MPEPPLDTSMILEARSGDKEAFGLLIRKLSHEMYRLAKAILVNDEDCADAMQETIVRAYGGITKLREPLFFRTWLFRILIRECQQTLRRNKKMLPQSSLPEKGVIQAIPDYDLHSAVDRLEESLRIAVKLHYFAELPLSRIGELMAISEGTVKSRLFRARKQLAEQLRSPDERKMEYELN
ncbi:sigma-70 family RNA polymerase sigma factor [Cohnella faecalis]|uniref:Sigma-70 family RNA polymerase sigma factor n=1 Tax=Cohnella faecalis TaxID=2315694 RepID=A0A398CP30_9BACL|nr:sigma-70 family RNA polymerase sigma factor [Cohnella faecalis]RIE03960.1 sigma-70 family RNA polymerase sigma factor [Cohnella faecalis]